MRAHVCSWPTADTRCVYTDASTNPKSSIANGPGISSPTPVWVLGRRQGRSRFNNPGEQEPGAPAPHNQRAPRETVNPCRPWPSFPPRVRRGLASCLQQHDRSLGQPPRPVELWLPPVWHVGMVSPAGPLSQGY